MPTISYPNFDFCFENKPSGKPATDLKLRNRESSFSVHGAKDRVELVDRVARFFLIQDTQTENNVPNEHTMYQTVIKFSQRSAKYS
jgi:hypothetical protein